MPTNNQKNSPSETGAIPKSNLPVRSDRNLNDNTNGAQFQGSSQLTATRLTNNEDINRVNHQPVGMAFNINGRHSTPSIDGNMAEITPKGPNLNNHNGINIQSRYVTLITKYDVKFL